MYRIINDEKFAKIKLSKNSKIPPNSWIKKENWVTKYIDLTKCNYGILCGKVNNLIVIDLDLEKKKKDERSVPSGFVKMNEYINEHGNFDTFTVKTPSGGIHYYFLYNTKNKSINNLIEQIPNTTEFYGHGIDVRTEKKTGGPGGYVVGPESQIDGNKYVVINDKPIIEMPENLAFWLLQCVPNKNQEDDDNIKKTKKRTNVTKKVFFNPKYKYDTSIEYVEEILNKLPIEWVENRSNWLKVLTCLKNLNIDGNEDLFYKFSNKSTRDKHQTKTAKIKNKEEWDKNNCHIDFNYIICEVNRINKTNYPLIQKYRPIYNDVKFDNVLLIDNHYLEYDYDIFKNNENIIIQSTTGTGKTTDTAVKFNQYYIDNDCNKQIISIVALIATADQHIQTFKKKGIILNHYKTCEKNKLNDNLVICINSLLKLSFLSIEQIKDKIIYIDEFESFNNCLTHNKNLDNNIRLINNLLMKLIKNCHKFIISDALINQNALNFLSCNLHKKYIFINNTHKKYKGVNAIRYHNEYDFLNEVKQDIFNNNYFLFGSDSCSKITQYFDETEKQKIDEQDDKIITDIFNDITKDLPEKDLSKFLLITSKTAYKIKNANEEFNNKFVFYSPSIVNSVDFTSKDPQNQYLYFNSLTINSQSMFQQGTRTRNIKTLKFFANQRQHNYVYENIKEVETINKKLIETDDKIKKVCLNFDENDNEHIVENTFFKMWCFNEYLDDCYNTNKISHFQNILINEGFNLVHKGKDVLFDKNKVKEMINNTKNNELDKYNKFVELYKNIFIHDNTDKSNSDEDIIEFNNDELNKLRENKQYEKYFDRIEILSLKPDELAINKFGYLVMDEFNMTSYFNILKLFKTNEFIVKNMDDLKKTSYDIKIINNIYNKIWLLRQFETIFNIAPFELNFILKNDNSINNFTDELFNKYKKIFRSDKNKPKNINELRTFYVQMITNITGKNINIIDKNRPRENYIRDIKYKINIDIIKVFYDLSVRNGEEHNYDYDLLKIFNISKPNDFNNFCFGKK